MLRAAAVAAAALHRCLCFRSSQIWARTAWCIFPLKAHQECSNNDRFAFKSICSGKDLVASRGFELEDGRLRVAGLTLAFPGFLRDKQSYCSAGDFGG